MRRSLAVLCLSALAASGLAVGGPAAAAPAEQASPAAAAAVPDELLVGYVAGATATERGRARGRAGAERQERVVAAAADRTEVELVRLPAGKDRQRAIAELEADPAVAYAEPNWIYTHQAKPNAKPGSGTPKAAPDYFTDGSLWGMYGDAVKPNVFGSQAAEAWAGGNVGSDDVYIGVIDEGIQVNHPDLAPNIGVNVVERDGAMGVDDDDNGYVDDVHGWDFASGDSSVYDGGSRGSSDDHGTHVAGTIGASDERLSSTGAAQVGVIGVSPKVKMLSGKFLGRNGGSLSNAIKAVDYFTALKKSGLNVVATNNSWGGGGFSQGLLDAIVRGAKADILFVAAAGNSGSDNDITASYPSGYDTTKTNATTGAAAYDAVIAVAAIDKPGALASFSQYGAKTVDLGAPGVDIWSTTALNGYSTYNGTSMATPHVTGGVALHAAGHPGVSAAAIKAALLGAALPTASLSGKTVTGGRLDVSAL